MSQPNIVVIMTDTQPAPFLGCYSGQDTRTPYLDNLAKDGVRFSSAYTSCPLCTPARAGLFTGMMPGRAGAYTNSQPLGENILTLGQRLQSAGYRTAFIGKWHLDAHDYFGNGVCPPGWDDSYWYDGKRYLFDLSPDEVTLWRKELNTYAKLRDNHIKSEFTWAHRICDRAERFLGEQTTHRPFLLVTSFDEPHHPYTCPPEFIEPFLEFTLDIGPSAFDDLSNKPQHHQEWAEVYSFLGEPNGKYYNPMFLGCNSYVDSQIGRVAAAARHWSNENGRPTWIIFTSDHGDHIGSHRIHNKGPSGYENNVRIPMIIVPPDGTGAGTVQPSVVSHLDILPTLLELAGRPVPETLDGTSLLSLIGQEERDPDRVAVAEYTRYEVGHDGFGGLEPLRMYVKWPWKLVINLHRTDELYNLEKDPAELENLINDPGTATERDQLHQSLLDWMDQHVDPQRGTAWQRREWRDASSNAFRFKLPMRPVPDDGKMSPYYDYDTGNVTRGTAVQFGDD